MKIWEIYRDTSFIIKVTIGFLLGIAAGLIFSQQAAVLKPLGTLLINLLTFVAIPVIFLTVVLAVDQMNPKVLGKMGGKLILYYTVTTAAAVLIGTSLALWFEPGVGLSLPDTQITSPQMPHIADVLLQIVPGNIFEAFTKGNLMAIMFIAVVIELALSS